MKDLHLFRIDERLLSLIRHIEQLEQPRTIKGIEDIEHYSAEEDDVAKQLYALIQLAMQAGDIFYRKVDKRLQSLAMRLEYLPSVPRIEVVRLAQNMLTQQPLVLVTDDTINEERDHRELTRIFLMEPTEVPRFDYHFASSKPGNVRTLELHMPGKGQDASATLEKAWSEFQAALHGRYVVAFNLPLVQLQLAITAQEYGLPVPMLVGHCFLELLLQYARLKESISYGSDEDNLTNAERCDMLASKDVTPFCNVSFAPADQRALHLLHALRSMADGTLSLQEPRYRPLVEHLDPFTE